MLSGTLYNRLAEYAEEILGDYRCEFRTNPSTIDHIFTIRQIQEKAYEYNIHLHNLYIDFKQAFDSVNRSRMLNDLTLLGIPKKLTKLVGVTMAGPRATVRVDNQYTPTFPITHGVTQGDALSCILFDLVLEAITRKLNITGHIGTKSTQIFAYADVVAILNRNKNTLKDALGNTESEARKRGLLINENKTKYMEVTRTVVNGNHLQCGKYELEPVKELPYLDSQLTETNPINCEIQARTVSANRCYCSCGALIKSRALNRGLKIKLYTTPIRCAVTYGCNSTRCKWNLENQKEPRTE